MALELTEKARIAADAAAKQIQIVLQIDGFATSIISDGPIGSGIESLTRIKNVLALIPRGLKEMSEYRLNPVRLSKK